MYKRTFNLLILFFAGLFLTALVPQKSFGQSTPTPSPTPNSLPVPVTMVGAVLNGKAISLPKPIYPRSARKKGIQGPVRVEILIDKTGDVIKAKAIDGPQLLRRAAEVAALKSEFSPTYLGGRPVNVIGVVTYNFVR